jgi:uncharacterized protein (DUF1330 family)
MKYYAVGELAVTDGAWVRDYVGEVTGMVERHGGRYLSRTTRVEQLEAEAGREVPQLLMIIEWPSKEAAEAFYESEAYRPHREARRAGARNAFFLIPAEDSNGVARIEQGPAGPPDQPA